MSRPLPHGTQTDADQGEDEDKDGDNDDDDGGDDGNHEVPPSVPHFLVISYRFVIIFSHVDSGRLVFRWIPTGWCSSGFQRASVPQPSLL